MSHQMQALDTPSLFGKFQPATRRCIRERASDCVRSGRRFDVLDLMDCIHKAAGDTFTPTNLTSAFRRVGMWPLDPSRVPLEAMSKGAVLPVLGVDLKFPKARLIPIMREELNVPVVAKGTLSMAGRLVVLTAPEMEAALKDLDQEMARKTEAQRAGREAREKRSSELKAQRDAKAAAAEEAKARLMWAAVCDGAVEVARFWLLVTPSSRERASRQRAAKQRRRVQAPGLPLPATKAWQLCSGESAALGLWKSRWATTRQGRHEVGGGGGTGSGAGERRGDGSGEGGQSGTGIAAGGGRGTGSAAGGGGAVSGGDALG